MEVDSAIVLSPALTSRAMASKLDLQLSLRDESSPVLERVVAQKNSQREEEDEDENDEEANEEEEEAEEEDADCDFSFVCADACSPISADDLFHNGQIKPIFPWLGKDPPNLGEEEVRLMSVPVKKVFVERSDLPSEAEDVAEGPYCSWSQRTAPAGESTSAAPEACRKSNSTGFSKLRRFRDLLHRSQSDGKDTFVFLTKAEKEETTSLPSSSNKTNKGTSRKGKKDEGKVERKTTPSLKSKTTPSLKSKTTPSLSSYALQYGKNVEKGQEKRKSYLPYRQDLVGFFTNANAMSKNIHPY